MSSSLNPFFKAKGVAILGASTKPNKLSYGILENLLKYHYEGGIYPVNPKADEILGVRVYPSVKFVPDPVDLAVIVLPAGMIMRSLQECAERGIKAIVIITGGFREIGAEGLALENEALEFARAHAMRIVGPNCVGTMDMSSGLNTTFIKGMPDQGPIAFISQSGAVCGGVVDLIIESHVGFSHFASLGNEMDVTETDMMEYFAEDQDVGVIAIYVEGIQDGPRFMEVARRVSRIKPIVLLKAGKSNAGARAVSSHTGSLAGSYTAYQAAFEQSGVIEVQTLSELFNVAWALGTQPLPKGNQVALTTNAGGAAALLADNLAFNGFELATISPQIQETLRSKLNPSAQVANPVDMLGQAEPADYLWSLSNMAQDTGIDVLVPILVPQALVDPYNVAQAWVDVAKKTNKTFLTCLMGERSVRDARALLNQSKVPVYQYPDQIGSVLKAMRTYGQIKAGKEFIPVQVIGVDKSGAYKVLNYSAAGLTLGEYESRQLLQAYGIPNVPGDLAVSEAEAVEIAEQVGYPVVLKIAAESVLHKSDAGGIRLNLGNEHDLRVAFNDLIDRMTKSQPGIKIYGAMVEKMAGKGQEVIIGMRRDATFGPMIMFGMGGVLVEQLKDISFKVAPLSEQDIYNMIDATIAGKLLRGYRGSIKSDIDAVAEAIGRLSQLALDFPAIEEIEVNPLVVYPEGQGVLSLDSRAILAG